MPKFRYTGSDERVFPTLSLVVATNDEFDAPEGFDAPDVTLVTTSKKSVPSAPSDTTEGE